MNPSDYVREVLKEIGVSTSRSVIIHCCTRFVCPSKNTFIDVYDDNYEGGANKSIKNGSRTVGDVLFGTFRDKKQSIYLNIADPNFKQKISNLIEEK